MRERAKDPERHARRMEAKQRIMQERIARAQKEQGVLLVLTGPGKGKSSSGFGMVARALGHGMKVGIVQFIKGAFSTGEEAFFRDLPNVDYHVMGQGYTWETKNREQDVEAANAAWDVAAAMLKDDRYDLILLDELNIALKYDYIDLDRVLDDLQARSFRAQPGRLIEHAQLHPQALGPDVDGRVGQRVNVLALAKTVHHVDGGLAQVGQRRLGDGDAERLRRRGELHVRSPASASRSAARRRPAWRRRCGSCSSAPAGWRRRRAPGPWRGCSRPGSAWRGRRR